MVELGHGMCIPAGTVNPRQVLIMEAARGSCSQQHFTSPLVLVVAYRLPLGLTLFLMSFRIDISPDYCDGLTKWRTGGSDSVVVSSELI